MLTTNLKILLGSGAILALAAPSFAQNQTEVVGPPALEDFDLKGERIVTQPPIPAPRPQQQQQQTPVTVVPAPPSPAQSRPQPKPAQSQAEAPRRDARPVPASSQPVETAPQRVEADTPVTPTVTPSPVTVPPVQSPAQSDGVAPPPTALPEPEGGFPVWPAAAGGLILLGAGFYFGRRRSAQFAVAGGEVVRETAPLPEPPRPVPPLVAAAAAAATLAPKPRASVELLFEPTSTVLGDKDAIVHFLLTIHNDGRLAAKNVRLEARIFNANGQVDADIGQFFSAPLQRRVVSLPTPLPPGERLAIQGEVPIPVADIKPIAVDGRALFIPIVAVTAIYEWEGGSGQTSKSYMVGVEAQQTGKMGPFRLDQGPRVYRSVGQREHRLAHIA